VYNRNVKGIGVYMQVNSVSLQQSRAQSFGHAEHDFEKFKKNMQRQFAQLDDNTLKKLAYHEASVDVNDKKHRKINRAIIASIPAVAGLALASRVPSALLRPGFARGSKLAIALGEMLRWVGAFAVIDGVFGAKRLAEKSSKKVRKFGNEHPMLSTVATIGASLGALVLGRKGLSKLVSKLPAGKPNIATLKSVVKFNKHLNNNKILNLVSKGLSKVPASIKSVGKGILNNGVWILAGTSLLHAINHNKVKNTVAVDNYMRLKDAQDVIRTELAAEEAAETENV